MRDEVALRRFEKLDDARDCRLVDALHYAEAELEKWQPEHVMVLFAKRAPDDGTVTYRTFHAGDLSNLERAGLFAYLLHDQASG